MKRNVLKCASSIAVAAAVIVALSLPLHAVDSNRRYFAYGLGQRSCEEYVKYREKKLDLFDRQHERYTKDELYEIVDQIVDYWIAGFLTAHNLYVADTHDVAGNTTMDDLKARLEKICRANGNQYFAEATFRLVQDLNPQRVRAGGGKQQ